MIVPKNLNGNGRKPGRPRTGFFDHCTICGKEVYVRPTSLTKGLTIYCRSCANLVSNRYRHGYCPRCSGRLYTNWYGEKECINCGNWVDTDNYEQGLFLVDLRTLLLLCSELTRLQHRGNGETDITKQDTLEIRERVFANSGIDTTCGIDYR